MWVVFEAVDSDGDGEITAQELVNWMETQHIDIDNPMEAFFAADRAENVLWEDTLGLAEFKQLMLAEDLIGMEGEGRVGVQVRHGCGPPTRSAIILSKRRVPAGCAARCGGGPDLCKGGCISKSEIEEVLTAYSLPFETLDSAFAAIDTDGNGAIDAEEFKAFLLEQGVVAVKEKEAKGFFEQFFG